MFNWRLVTLLLSGIGISTLGDFIYLIAINLLVYEMTHSAAAVAGLWIVGPITSILTNSWSGSIIDRANKKKIMIIADLARAVGVAIIPFVSNIWTIYVLLFLISVARAFFAPSSTTYIAKLIPVNKRKKFNSINSLVTSGAFIVGPSIAGALFLIGSVKIAILLNAVSFLISAFIIMFLPDTDQQANPAEVKKGSYETLRDDWKEVIQFGREKSFVLAIYACFLAFGLFSLTLDSQEVVFIQDVVGLTETDYSFLVSITGIGYSLGAFLVTVATRFLSIKHLIAGGMLMVAIGYLIYALSNSFVAIAIGFTILGFFNAFSNTGFSTFYQNNVPIHLMGRMTSVIGVIQSGAQIVFLLLIGVLGDISPLRYTIVILAGLNMILSVFIVILVAKPGKQVYFSVGKEETVEY